MSMTQDDFNTMVQLDLKMRDRAREILEMYFRLEVEIKGPERWRRTYGWTFRDLGGPDDDQLIYVYNGDQDVLSLPVYYLWNNDAAERELPISSRRTSTDA